MSEDQAYIAADLIADVTVLSVTPLVGDKSTNQTAAAVTVRILTQGVYTKETVSIRWNQRLADATGRKLAPPLVGRNYRTFLRERLSAAAEFEGVHPEWAFIGPLTTAVQPVGFVDHVIKPGDTLYGLAGKFYGRPWKWHVIRLANFALRAEGEVYPLRVGMTIRVPVLLIHKNPLKQENEPTAATDTNEWTEKCKSCGKTTYHYAYCFDADDYAILSILLRGRVDSKAYLPARAPHGPDPGCSSRYTTNSLPYLKQKMPQLQDETYASFLERNKRIAVHRVKTFKNADGVPIRVLDQKQDDHSMERHSRAGFNRDKTQVLIFTGELFYLYEKKGNDMTEVARCLMWIS
jgi:hypothetical protein